MLRSVCETGYSNYGRFRYSYLRKCTNGVGFSSSAALEVVTAFALDVQLGTSFNRTVLAQIDQKAEHEFAFVNCGIMDQFASANGAKYHAIQLNRDTLEFELEVMLLIQIPG